MSEKTRTASATMSDSYYEDYTHGEILDRLDILEQEFKRLAAIRHRSALSVLAHSFALVINELVGLIKVKSIITFAVVYTLCMLTIKDKIPTELFMTVASSVLTYYFTKGRVKNESD